MPSSAVAVPPYAKTGGTEGVGAMYRKRAEAVLQVSLCAVPVLCFAVLRRAVLCFAELRCAVLCHAVLCSYELVVLCCAALFYVLYCYVCCAAL